MSIQALDITVKIILLGNRRVGKTALIRQIFYNTFDETYDETLGAEYTQKILPIQLDLKTINVKLCIWDVSGHSERYSQVWPIIFENTQIVLLIIDLSKRNTLLSLHEWITAFRQYGIEAMFYIIGTKLDLRSLNNEKSISKEQGEEISRQISLEINKKVVYSEVSAKTGENIQQTFMDIIRTYLVDYSIKTLK